MIRSSACDTMLISSEDFETLLTDPATAQMLENAALEYGVENIVWLFRLRRPGSYFMSLLAQLPRHRVLADPTAACAEIMENGFWQVENPDARKTGASVHWKFVFDYSRLIDEFRRAVGGQVIDTIYRDGDSFPGDGLLDSDHVPQSANNALKSVWYRSGQVRINPRISEEEICELEASALSSDPGYARFTHDELLEKVVIRRQRFRELVPDLASRIDRRFGGDAWT